MKRRPAELSKPRRVRFLLGEYLEGVSRELLLDYHGIVKGLIKGRHGVYALYRGDRLQYVGLTKNLMGRLKSHLKDRHHESWDRFSVYLTVKIEHIKELESLLLRIAKPAGNRAGGRLVHSRNLMSQLEATIRASDEDRRALLLGGSVARRRRRVKVRSSNSRGVLEGLSDRRIRLKGTYKGQTVFASLLPSGKIRLGGVLHSSPSSAARSVFKGLRNGWHFWNYKKSGKWIRLNTLKR